MHFNCEFTRVGHKKLHENNVREIRDFSIIFGYKIDFDRLDVNDLNVVLVKNVKPKICNNMVRPRGQFVTYAGGEYLLTGRIILRKLLKKKKKNQTKRINIISSRRLVEMLYRIIISVDC